MFEPRHNPAAAMRSSERGNVLIIIFMAVVLIAALTAAIHGSNRSETASTDSETLMIRLSEVQRYASELERGVLFVLQNGYSEDDIRFAHPNNHTDYGDLGADTDPSNQIFHQSGGGALYRLPPSGINDGSPWEFYGATHVPSMGSDRAELVAVLPNVAQEFCDTVNEANSQSNTPSDTGAGFASGGSAGGCINAGAAGRFNDTQQYYSTPNTMLESSFEQDPASSQVRPAPQACVTCSADSANHFYHVILTR